MGKLIFQDDAGNDHEITVSQISSKGLKSGDILTITYEVGAAAPKDVTMALTQLKRIFDQVLPEGVKTVVFAARNGKKDIQFKILKDDTTVIT